MPPNLAILTETARADWREAVANESTRLGFREWIEHNATEKEEQGADTPSDSTQSAAELRAVLAEL